MTVTAVSVELKTVSIVARRSVLLKGIQQIAPAATAKTNMLIRTNAFIDLGRGSGTFSAQNASHGARHAVTLLHFIVGPHLVRAGDVLGIGNCAYQC